MLPTILYYFIAILVVFVAYNKWKYNYWKRMGVIQFRPKLIVGDFVDVLLLRTSRSELFKNFYFYIKSKRQKYGGMYLLFKPLFMPVDTTIIKDILQTNCYSNFMDRGTFADEYDPLTMQLFNLQGEKWRTLRAKLSPTFTSGKIKNMFHILQEKTNQLVSIVRENPQQIEVKELIACYTTDIIGNCAFGIDCNSMTNNNEEFRKYGRKFFERGTLNAIFDTFLFLWPDLSKTFGKKTIQEDVSNYFMTIIRNNIDYRRNNNIERKDFFDLLLKLLSTDDDDDDVRSKQYSTITFNEMAAQAFVFYLGGFETSSGATSVALFELARNKEIQAKARTEINKVLARYNGEITYEALQEMHYLEDIINEAMRLYPPFPFLNRICTNDYKIPGTDITLIKGTSVIIPVAALHRDPEFHLEPDRFNPDRFSQYHNMDSGAFLPFGYGPRICIGSRFGMTQSKMGLCAFLKNFQVNLNSRTIVPLELSKTSLLTQILHSVYLDFIAI